MSRAPGAFPRERPVRRGRPSSHQSSAALMAAADPVAGSLVDAAPELHRRRLRCETPSDALFLVRLPGEKQMVQLVREHEPAITDPIDPVVVSVTLAPLPTRSLE